MRPIKKAIRFFWVAILASGMTALLVACGSVQTCPQQEQSLNYTSQTGPVCQVEPGHEPRALEGFSGINP